MRVRWKGFDDSSLNFEIFSHLSWFLTGKNLSLGTLVRNMQDKIRSFIGTGFQEYSNVSLQNGLILTKHPGNQLDLKIDSYYKTSVNCEVPLGESSSFVFDDCFVVNSMVYKPSRAGMLKFLPSPKAKVSGFVLPVFCTDRGYFVEPILFHECFVFKTEYYRVCVVYRPPRSLLSEGK